jgi:transcriptional regulator with XRE-family HTH domain
LFGVDPGRYAIAMGDQDISAAQVRAARALLGWSQETLAKRSRIARATLQHFEAGRRDPVPGTLTLLRQTLEAAGVMFIDPNGGGPGVRLRK